MSTPRYIDAEQIHYEDVEFSWGIGKNMTTKKDVDRVPTADVIPVVHAHWQQGISGMYAGKCACSECTRTITGKLEDIEANCKFCPYCGAKMDEIQLAAKEREAGRNYEAAAPNVIEKE